jgi:myosin heavy subunit
MLIAINPYEILPIYTMDQIHFYQERSMSDIPPHIFAIGDSSYRELLDTASNQCIVIRYLYKVHEYKVPLF